MIQVEKERDAERRTKRAEAERTRRARKREEDNERLAARAKELVPQIKAPFYPRAVSALAEIIGRSDPIDFAFAEFDGEPYDRDARIAVLGQWSRAELPAEDPVAKHLRGMAIRVKVDPRTPLVSGRPDLWGRKVGALLLALAER